MAKSDGKDLKTGTKVVTVGRRPEWTGIPGQPGAVVNPAVWRASTHLYEDSAALAEGLRTNEDGRFFYGRRGSPTQWALCEALTQLEPGAHGTVLYPSGVAAIAGALLSVVKPGDTLLVTDNAYDPTRNMGMGLLKTFGVETKFFDPLDLNAFRALVAEGAQAVFLEAPGSLSFEVCDIPALVALAREAGAWVLIDNTWPGPTGLRAIELGCDGTVNALTKHVGGHSDLMMGAATGTERLYRRLRRTAQQLGQVVSPDDAALALRGLRTLEVRLQRESESALAIAQWLSERPEVEAVLCPMLDGAPGHDLWKRDFVGGCGLFGFVLKTDDPDARARFIDALELFGIGYSWGGFESLALPTNPAKDRSVASWPPVGVDPTCTLGVRLSIGLEDPADLIADLKQAFEKMERA
ncbi:cystathionine beta-lyase [Croceicoccus pelagius]|uniref:Cystathionine beta-lyase n=1 Tax=Croceicoccus pelagius TaxID=1703341 RepID=A0A916YBD3_9SPHN|nr:cystathionine beta-lyase [Croceicoccus pelagius]GGD37731.1 cystathionine beta-lyase [Croceicoccus pelagius]